jgi:hypothetical protein
MPQIEACLVEISTTKAKECGDRVGVSSHLKVHPLRPHLACNNLHFVNYQILRNKSGLRNNLWGIEQNMTPFPPDRHNPNQSIPSLS